MVVLVQFRDTADHQIKNTIMSCEYSINEAEELVNAGLPKEQVLKALATAKQDLHTASDECYQQQVLCEVNNGTYTVQKSVVEFRSAVQSACKRAVYMGPHEEIWLLVDMVLLQHILYNAVSNGIKHGDNSIARPLQLTYRIIQLTNSDGHLLIVELTNPAGSNHESLMRMRDSNGRIEMEEMRKLSNWGKGRSSGLGTDIILKCANMLNASVCLEVINCSTTFVARVPVHVCNQATPESSHSLRAPKQFNSKLSHAAVVQAHTSSLKGRALCLQIQRLGFVHVSIFGRTAESVRQAVNEIATCGSPPQVIFVDRFINIPGLEETEMNGIKLLADLSHDDRVSGMRVICDAEAEDPSSCQDYHCAIRHCKVTSEFSSQFFSAWHDFIPSRPLHSCRIAIVDDCPMVVKLMKRALLQAGVSLHSFESGNDFVEMANPIGNRGSFPFDFCLLDYTMPGLNGLETLQMIPSEVKERMKVIMHTSEPGAELLQAFKEAGAITCVPKRPGAFQVIKDLVIENRTPLGK